MTEEKHPKKYVEGRVMVTAKGGGFVDSGDEKIDDIKIEPAFLGTTFHGDTVRVLVYTGKDKYGRTTGEVVEVLVRARENFVATLRKEEDIYFAKAQNTRIHVDFIIPEKYLGGGKVGDKVIVHLVKWSDAKKNPLASVIEVIGEAGLHETEMRAIVRDRGFAIALPDDVEKEAEKVAQEYPARFKEEEKTRRDFRDTQVFTIDPDDAKDYDDALSFKKLSGDLFEVGIHIADVSFFVTEGSLIDKEAIKRGTSIYLVDRTIPMLPEILSNDLASLVPNKDRLVFSAVFTMNKTGDVKERWFGRGIIRSAKRFTYATAQEVLDTKKGEFSEALLMLDTIALKLREKRAKEGAFTFGQEEIKFELDAEGKPIRVYKKERLETNKLIEDFMVLANAEVAMFASGKDRAIEQTFIYRVHDVPDQDRVHELVRMLGALGYKVPKTRADISHSTLNTLLGSVGEEHRQLVETAAIQSMAKAVYSTKNIGHFGLSLKHYTHFTSPIRRYPDLAVHRLLAAYLAGKKVAEEDVHIYEAISRFSSQLEVSAQDAERASIKLKQVEYMSRFVGDIREGVITGMTERGFFVRENETLAEGLVHLRDLKDDYYVLDDTSFRIVGSKKKKTYTLGDKIRIKIKAVDMEKRLIDYTLV
ncbi:MAG: ribonuclease R [Candidatus Lloydbacteria bacterium RIFCSPHIGHO2_02_FULL_51_22]|uniref:Ribonuclease R n=2 Tax=Candidatus Lloydiibacteriota TaxID=1817910 RepID=A0A1G2DEZ1_9BACT|nr:MAG: ribonuclease R [Candidatus Lloydbacteria bacterium RIFCSPHIGHO2_02_FULL_51_22]OGZ15288.1 MAG: ribonuclease R [Candidatus Lloydbacteria bacterium RIFCSPLOWO2_02_FULL_51_11]